MSRTRAPQTPERAELAMELALELARRAAARGEVPVGAVLLSADGSVLAARHNEIEARADPTAHAELLALRDACRLGGDPRLPPGTLLAATLEPCAMCAGGIVLARVEALVFGALDPKTGACGSLRDIVRDERLNHRVDVLERVRGDECGELLRAFFRARR